MEKIFICIPTYNEADNIVSLLKKINKAATHIHDYLLEIVIIDDNSPDGTAEVAAEFSKGNKLVPVHFIHNKGKAGLGKAYIQGFEFAIAHGAFAVCEMDADLSHDPKYLVTIAKLIKTHDLVIASRYIEDGGTINWGIKRQILSKGGNLYSRMILGIGIHDLTGGYNCYRTSIFNSIPLSSIRSLGYAFQIELKYRVLKAGFTWIETPIVFMDRVKGISKLSDSIVSEAILTPWKLRGMKLTSRDRSGL